MSLARPHRLARCAAASRHPRVGCSRTTTEQRVRATTARARFRACKGSTVTAESHLVGTFRQDLMTALRLGFLICRPRSARGGGAPLQVGARRPHPQTSTQLAWRTASARGTTIGMLRRIRAGYGERTARFEDGGRNVTAGVLRVRFRPHGLHCGFARTLETPKPSVC